MGQKMTGLIIILTRLTKVLPIQAQLLANSGATTPTTMPAITATMTPM